MSCTPGIESAGVEPTQYKIVLEKVYLHVICLLQPLSLEFAV